jgi:Xaa-Pro dipeptidase
MNIDYAVRQTKLKGITGVDAVALVPGANMTYFTGLNMHLSERPTIAIFSDTGAGVIIPEVEVPILATRPDLEFEVFAWKDETGFEDAFNRAVKGLRLTDAPLGVDGQTMRVFEYLAFQQAGSRKMSDVGKDLLHIRALKSEDEVKAIREAIRLSEQALHRLMNWVKPGMTEREIAAELARLLREAGSVGPAFGPLVQSGPNSALPHGGITQRPLEENDFLLIDFGGLRHGYPADITRTFCLGTPTEEMEKIYATVLAANRAAVAIAKPGIACSEVDKAARDVIEAAGYGEYFIHRTGHGLGLEIHELPQIAAGVDVPLETGMVFTIEPGIYVPGLGGVRIEDDVHVTEEGIEVLSQYPRRLTAE